MQNSVNIVCGLKNSGQKTPMRSLEAGQRGGELQYKHHSLQFPSNHYKGSYTRSSSSLALSSVTHPVNINMITLEIKINEYNINTESNIKC